MRLIPQGTAIPVRSEKQAMDWSLVLVSQGIESAIDQSPEDGRWRLLIDEGDDQRARQVLHLYIRENKLRRWQQPVLWTGLLLDWRAIFALLPLVGFFFVSDVMDFENFKSAGTMDSVAVRAGQWWRIFTAVTLHADSGHLASNLATGILLLGLAMGSYGAGKALLASFLAGAGGNLAGLVFLGESHRSLGASGMILGALGLLTVQSLSLWRSGEDHQKLVVRGVGAGCLLLVLLGLNPHSDVTAHIGGFVCGCLLGVVLTFLPAKLRQSAALDLAAGFACAAGVGVSWWLALR